MPILFPIVVSMVMGPIGSARADQFAEFRLQYETLMTVAGNGARDGGNDWKPSDEGKLATRVDLSRPHMCMADIKGNYYIADKEANAIRKVLPGEMTGSCG